MKPRSHYLRNQRFQNAGTSRNLGSLFHYLRNQRFQNDGTSRNFLQKERKKKLTTYRPVGYAAGKNDPFTFQEATMSLEKMVHVLVYAKVMTKFFSSTSLGKPGPLFNQNSILTRHASATCSARTLAIAARTMKRSV